MTRVWDVPVHDSTRLRDARVAAECASALAGLDRARADAAALVATELATNLLKHAHGGQLLVEAVCGPGGRAAGLMVQIAAVDHGPGMADVPAALGDGFSTAGSLGAGLGTCRRLADDFDLHSVPGRGTVAIARMGGAAASRGGRDTAACPSGSGPAGGDAADAPLGVRAGGVNIPFRGAEHSGDAWTCVRAGHLLTLMLADGLGHGPDAALASTAAVEAVRGSGHLPPAELLRRLDDALRGTRGAAAAVTQLDARAGRLRFCGVGNVGRGCARATPGGICCRGPASSARTGPGPCPRRRPPGARTGSWSCTATGCPAAGRRPPIPVCSAPTPRSSPP